MSESNQSSSDNHPIAEIQLGDHKITLLGTAHVSRASAEKVRELIDSGEFDTVAVELCPSRHQSIVNADSLAKMDLFAVLRQRKAAMVAANLALSAYQQRMADEYDIRPGEEMRVAVELAGEKGLPVLLIDREIGTTLKRVYRNVPWWKRWGIMSGLFTSLFSREKVSEDEIERLKEGDVLESTFAQFADEAKDIYVPLVDERDRYMSARLRQEHAEGGSRNTLAVIGAGHLKGMTEYLQYTKGNPQQEIDELDQLPPPSKWLRYVPWIIAALVVTGFLIGFSRSPELGWQLISDWVFINGGLAALGALIAGAHWITVVTAFLAAPLTSLNPAIGVGMVTALTETFLRKPTVGDFSDLRKDTVRLKGWWTNRVTRILLVFLLSSMGSAFGTYVAGFAIFDRLSS